MGQFIDKIPLGMCCLALINYRENGYLPVVIILVAVSVTALDTVFNGKTAALCFEIAYVVICGINRDFTAMLPFIIYDIMQSHHYFMLIPSAAVVVYYCLFLSQPWQIIIICGTIASAVVLEIRTEKGEAADEKLIRLRDNTTELTMLLKSRNRSLLEQQDNEVYTATLRERNRIAREIHDNVGHMLSRSLLQVGALIAITKDNAEKEQLDSIKNTLNSAMTSIRESVHDLHNDSIDLKQAVIDCTAQMTDYKIITDFDFSSEVPRNIKLCFIGIVKEAMSNIIKHSDADKVTIYIREHPGFYQLSVEDNGKCGPITESTGIGITNMEERVRALNGIFRASGSENGFRIFVSVNK